MAITRNFKIAGIVHDQPNISVKLNGNVVFDGPAQTGEVIAGGLDRIAMGSFTYEQGSSSHLENHTTVACEITVKSAGMIDVGYWVWSPTFLINQNLPQQCLDYLNSRTEGSPWSPPDAVDQAAIAAGGWWTTENPVWWGGGKVNDSCTRFNVMINGSPGSFQSNAPLIFGISQGQVLTYDLDIPNLPEN